MFFKKNLFKVMLLVVVLVMALSACNAAATEAPAVAAATTAPAAEEEKPFGMADCGPNCTYADMVMCFPQLGAESDWRTADTASFKDEAAKDGFQLVFSDAQQKQENQISAVRSCIQQGVSVIALPPVVEDGWDAVLTEAHNAGIPVIIVDRSVSADASLYVSHIGFDMDLRAGEVIGLAGLLGSGRTEVAELLFGIDNPTGGSMRIDGKPVWDYSPLQSINRGVALCPEDRKDSGIVGELTVRENIILAMQAGLGWFKYLRSQEQNAIADKYIKLLNIATPSADQAVKNLSGGNQQKVILARWLATNPRLLILDEPTRGIDVGAKAEIQKLVLALAEEGKSCIFISSELEEVLRTSHRIAVMRERKMVAEFTEEAGDKIMEAIAGSSV